MSSVDPAATEQSVQVVQCRELRKHFHSGTSFADLLRGRLRGRRVDALRGLDLELRQGEILGLMGPNGAGKSTLLRLVAGLLIPDAGQLQVLGCIPWSAGAAFRRRVCFVNCDERSFSWRLSGQQNLEFFVALYGLTGAAARQRIERALALTDLGPDAARPVREYSTGMRQRLALARGLLGEPEIFLFDEPTSGVDPVAARRLRRLIREEVVGAGHTALVATHSFSDVDDLCQQVVLLQGGRIVERGPAQSAAQMVGRQEAAP